MVGNGNATNDSEIDAISGATITTKAIVNGVNAGLEYFRYTFADADGKEALISTPLIPTVLKYSCASSAFVSSNHVISSKFSAAV